MIHKVTNPEFLRTALFSEPKLTKKIDKTKTEFEIYFAYNVLLE